MWERSVEIAPQFVLFQEAITSRRPAKMLRPMMPMVISQGESPQVVALIMEQMAKKNAAKPPQPPTMAR